ncbi:MAG TPA: CHAT domain-containing protein [Bryobacteraceae bacterium]|nr:CHAT domain-containing protein [Bryobacteraceae bacterium]
MKQIKFELLRHGPPNNQLLSPLTQYLAICENHPATTLQVPFEHNQFLHRLRALSYALGQESRAFQVKDTAQVLADLLGKVPGLVAEMNRDDALNDDSGLRLRDPNRATHLRMILSASELALLPFELTLSPPGFPGSGQPLLLQFKDPICMTREVRRVAERSWNWPQNPKVLFIYASPGNVGAVPWQDHLETLRRLLEPWANYAEPDEQKRFDEHLTVLPNASCAMIERACAQDDFSHVHILAHGIEYSDGYDTRFGLALHDPQPMTNDGVDRVSGERLATALRAVRATGSRRLASPLVVTVASCDSGNQGTVGGLGGSVAFALHQAEIPMVIASQFPLSVAASSVFVRAMYEPLLWGLDPRIALNDLRRRLHTMYPTTHDWASVTAYASLPNNFHEWLTGVQVRQTYRSMEAAMKFADFVTERVESPETVPAGPTAPIPPDPAKTPMLDDATEKMEAARRRVERLFESGVGDRAELAGKLAATDKRCAQVYYYFSHNVKDSAPYTEKWQRLLQKSRQHYWNVFELSREKGWAVVQFLSLDLILRRLKAPVIDLLLEPHEEHNNPVVLWNMAHDQSINDLRDRQNVLRHWALGNLVELYLIALIMDPRPRGVTLQKCVERAKKYAKDLVDSAGPDSFEVYSTRRQILRYDDWYWEIAEIDEIKRHVGGVIRAMPAVAQP